MEAAQSDLVAKITAEETTRKEYETLKEGDEDESNDATIAAKSEWEAALEAKDNAEQEVKQAEKDVADAEKALQDMKDFETAIKSAGEAALTSASASAGGSGQFSQIVDRKPIDKDTAEHIANAVENIVSEVLGKSYVAETCLSFLVANNMNTARTLTDEEKSIEEVCRQQIGRAAKEILTSSHGPDQNTVIIRARLENGETTRENISEWLRSRGVAASVGYFLNANEFKALREFYVSSLNNR